MPACSPILPVCLVCVFMMIAWAISLKVRTVSI
jgi:hypothetical protein